MSSGPEGAQMPSQPGRIYECICSDSCVIQEPLDVAGGYIYDNAMLGHGAQRGQQTCLNMV